MPRGGDLFDSTIKIVFLAMHYDKVEIFHYASSCIVCICFDCIRSKFSLLLLLTCSTAFVLRHPLVASAVFGATKVWQIKEVLEATKIDLSADIIAEINEVHARYPNPCP